MSDQEQVPESEETQAEEQAVPVPKPEHECEICGENGFYGTECSTCKRPITQRRQYTLSEVRSGQAGDLTNGRPSGAPPRIVEVPGSIRVQDLGK